MGVDLGTYRGRIGTFKFAFGDDVVTVNCYINFSRGLKTISVVTFIGVLFLLASTDTWSIQNEHATAILATNPQQPGSVWFMDMLLLMAGIEPNPGPILCDKILSMLIFVVVFLAMVYVMAYTDTSQSTKVLTVCVALLTFAAIYIQRRMTDTSALVKDEKCQGFVSTSQRMNAEDERTLFPKEKDVKHLAEHNETENSSKNNMTKTDNRTTSQTEESDKKTTDEQKLDGMENGSKDNAAETARGVKDQGSVLIYQRMNTEEKSTQEPKEINVIHSDEHLPPETENGSKDYPTDTVTAQDQGSFSTSQRRINAEDESSPKPKEIDVLNEDEHLPSEMDNCSKNNTNETAKGDTDQSTVSSSEIMNAEDVKTSQLNTIAMENSDKQLPYETETSSKDNPTDTAKNDKRSVSTSERMNEEDKMTTRPEDKDVSNPDKQLPNETENGRKDKKTETDVNRTFHPDNIEEKNTDEQPPDGTHNGSEDKTTEKVNENEGNTFFNTLQKLGLTEKFPGKISRRDIMEAESYDLKEQEKKCISFVDIPWLFLKRLIYVHSECRDIKVTEDESCDINSDLETNMCFMSEMLDESQDISPLDVINVVFHCLDPFMKQIFFQKSYLCKIAIPFLYKKWETNESHRTIISVWPLRSLSIENRTPDIKGEIQSKEVDTLQLKTNVLAFSRFGRPHYSKSKLINNLLTNQNCDTFFNIDCPSGMAQRYLSNGQIEMFWLPTLGDKKDRFHEAVTFLNMRGDINKHFERDVLSFMTTFIDVFVIIIDVETLLTQSDKVKATIRKFLSVVLIIANPVRPEAVKNIQVFQKDVNASGINLRILSTHKGVVEQNVVDMVSVMHKHIQSQLEDKKTQSYQQRLSSAKLAKVETDEDNEICQKGKNEATLLIQQMKMEGSPEAWKQVLTPVHCTFSQELGKLLKKREREKDFSEGNSIDLKIKTIREKQTQSVTKTVQLFIEILIRNETSHLALNFFLCWLKFYIESEKRQILYQLMFESGCAWERLKELKGEDTNVESETKDQKTVITNLEKKIEEASFTIEHFFREIGHIYEAILELHLCPTKFELPQFEDISKLIGRLVADGHQLELIDGESFYMPYFWTKAVLQEVDRCIGSSKVMALSVLGLQSSGKSTLMNTMFGSQFSTRTGRCTKGIHVQLVPVKFARSKDASSPFSYVLVVDTEGLRSPELSHTQHEHDNELATVITGIGDITILNVMGENTSEIKDILQVIVHAFLRLKMTNPKLDINKCCAFIHQNVADTSASENMRSGLSKLMQTLDEMTKESARSESISEITTFNQVIEFDINSQVWYLKNLWQGNPPMSKVNSEYSERVVDIKCQILNKALTMKDKSYKSLSDVVDQAHSLWKGVLNEDFVFSFRNSLEMKACIEMEKFVNDKLWQLESLMNDKLISRTHNGFANCNQTDEVQNVADKLTHELSDVLADEKHKTEKHFENYFEENKYKDITIQWKHKQQNHIDTLCETLDNIIHQQIKKSKEKRSVVILTSLSRKKHEQELRDNFMKVTSVNKGKQLSEEQTNKLFDDIWQPFVTNFVSTDKTIRTPMKTVFISYLNKMFKKNHAVIKNALVQSNELTPILLLEKLKGSFNVTGINEKDIGLTFFQKGKDLIMMTNTMEHITSKVNQFFENADDKILQLCQVNDEITESDVKQLFHELETNIRGILKVNTKNDFKVTFYAKLFVHVSRYAHPVFEKHNENYFRNQGTAARLELYKQQQKIIFEAHLKNCQSDKIVAKLFSNIIEGFAEEFTLERLPYQVIDIVLDELGNVKNRVIVKICSDLLEKNIFSSFIRYIQAPNEYACVWITKRANCHLFDKKLYLTTATRLLENLFTDVSNCVKDLMNSYIRETPHSCESWINDFQTSLKKLDYAIPFERFERLKLEIKQIQNLEYLTDEIKTYLKESQKTIIKKFEKHRSDSVQWSTFNPIDRVKKKLWGCPEQCAFCGEPCAKIADHRDADHYSIQHRPSCCIGIRNIMSKKACLTSCAFDIQSNTTHTCGVFDYLCNKGTRENCSLGKHNYRDYKQFLPQWNISPTSNMHDSSKFWMWFVATYKQELQDYFKYLLDDIPSSWNDISKEEAQKSLENIYSA